MKQLLKGLSLLALVSATGMSAVTTFFSPRSQSVDSANELVGWANDYHINLYDMCGIYGSFSVKAEYQRSFRPSRITRALFGPAIVCPQPCSGPTIPSCGTSGNNECFGDQLVVSGSTVATRGATDLLADYFGLPTDFRSILTFKPRVDNFLVDFNFYLGLDEWLEGLYFRIHAPVVHTRWKLGFDEAVTAAGATGYNAGYFSPRAVTPAGLLSSFSQFVSGSAIPNLNQNAVAGDPVVGFQPLAASRFYGANTCDSSYLKKTRLSDIIMALGWNFWQCEDYHFGLNLRAAAPTGNRPKGLYLFEPIVGNGKHWELGGGLTAHYTFWRSCDYESSLGIYLDANITHLFRARQCRVFDLKGRPLSRYMTAELLGANAGNLFGGAPVTAADAQFANQFAPVANLTRLPVRVSVGVQADVTALLNYTVCGFTFDLGYNLWARSCDKIRLGCGATDPFNGQWALKGTSYVYGFIPGATPGATTAIPLSATNSAATVFAGTANGGSAALNTNPGIDGQAPAFADAAGLTPILNAPVGGVQTNTSIQPVVLTLNDIDICSSKTKGLSHKVFGHFGYTFRDLCNWAPFIGIGGSAEFAQTSSNRNCGTDSCTTAIVNPVAPLIPVGGCSTSNYDCGTSCGDDNNRSCQRASLSLWSVWVKGGISFH